MKSALAVAAVAATFTFTAAAQMVPGMGPGMAGAQGMGPATMGGQHMGPGTMGGQHRGPGMMGGQHMGPGMGGEHEGCGMQAGKMEGPGGMHAGMMGGMGALERLNLSDEQRGKVRDIQRDQQRKHHALMGSMHEVRWQAEDNDRSAKFDDAAVRKNYDAMAAVRKQVFETGLEAQKKIDAVLTPEQREQLGKSAHPAGRGPR